LLERTTQLNDTISSKAAKLADQNARLDSTATVQKKLAEEARRKTLLLEALQLAERSLESPDKDSARLMSIVAYTQYVENGGSAYDPKLYAAMMAAVLRYKSMIVQQLEFVPYAFAYNPGNEVRYYISASSRLLAEDQNSLNTEFGGKRVFGDLFLTLAQDFSSVLVTDMDHRLLCVDSRTLELRREFPPCQAAITSAVQMRAGDTYLSGDLAGNLVEYSAGSSYSPSVRYHSTSGMIQSLALHPAGDRIAIGTRDSIIILSLRDYRKIGAIGVPSAVTAMCFNRTGNRLVFGADAGHVGFWDQVEDKVRMARFHSGRVTSVSYSPNFEYVASSSYDRTLRLWRTAYPLEPPLVLKGHLSWVTGFGFSEDSRTIYSVSKDKTMREWHTNPEALKAELEGCSDANRNQK
jgi:WD40 repeat protein